MQLKSRIIALPLVAVLASGAFFHSAPAQAAPKSKTYKAGAIALGALGAYFLSKGKTVEGAAALGGGYLAYKQGEKERNNERYGSNYNGDRYVDNNRYDNGRYNNDNADWNNGNDYRYNNSSYGNQGYSNPNSSNYANGSDPECRENTSGNGRGNAWGRSGGKNNGRNQNRGNGRSWQR